MKYKLDLGKGIIKQIESNNYYPPEEFSTDHFWEALKLIKNNCTPDCQGRRIPITKKKLISFLKKYNTDDSVIKKFKESSNKYYEIEIV